MSLPVLGEENNATQTVSVQLTVEEQQWLDIHPQIIVGGELDWAPFDFVGSDGEYQGISKDVMDLIGDKTGLDLVYKIGQTWNELVNSFSRNELSILPAMYQTPEREAYTIFTKPYFSIYNYVFMRSDRKAPTDINELTDYRIAVIDGYSIIGEMEKQLPGIEFLKVKSLQAGIDAVLFKKADAYVDGYAVVAYQLAMQMQTGIKPVMPLDLFTNSLRIGVNKSETMLASIINKGLAAISADELLEIRRKWFSMKPEPVTHSIELSPEERSWLDEHPVVRFTGDPDWLPFEVFREDGQYEGIVADHLDIIEERLKIRFERIPTNDWSESLQKAMEYEVDVISESPGSVITPKFLFTDSYLSSPIIWIVASTAERVNSFDELSEKRVALVEGYGYTPKIIQDHPDLPFVLVNSVRDGLEQVATGQIDAFCGSLANSSYFMNEMSLNNIKIGGVTGYDMHLSLAVRKDWPELHQILNKAVASITPQEHRDIMANWGVLEASYLDGFKVELTEEEQAWIDKNETIKYVIDPNREPFEYLDDLNAHSGITSSILDLLSKRGSLEFEMLPSDNWEQSVELIQRGQADMFSFVIENEERLRYMDFSDRILYKVPLVIVSSIDDAEIYDNLARQLSGKKIGLVKGRAIGNKLIEEYPDVEFLYVETAKEGFDKVHDGEIDMFAINQAFAKYFIKVRRYEDIKISAATDLYFYFKIAVQKSLPNEVLSIINKTLGTISNEELSEIYADWTEVSVEKDIDYSVIWKIGLGFLVLLVMVLFWNRSLGHQIKERKITEKKLASSMEKHRLLAEDLSRYLSPQVYDSIFSGERDVSVVTERKKLTVFFSDIKDFTATTEELEPEDMTYLLNDYLTKMNEIALEYGGTIDKFIGDAVVVFFGDPETRGVREDATAAICMAVAMQRRLVDLRAKWADKGFRLPFHIRCGINTGYCNVGNFGSNQRIDYTIIGGQVNLAARLESICKPDGVTVSYETYSLIRDKFDATPLEPISVKGIKEPVTPYAINGIFEDWDESERYIRRNDVPGLRIWVDLMRLNEDQRVKTLDVLNEVAEHIGKMKVQISDDH